MPGIQNISIEDLLEMKRLRYTKARAGDRTIYTATGSISVAAQSLKKLPDLGALIVVGDFDCSQNDLLTLRGAPLEVTGNFICKDNPRLPSLLGLPEKVGGKIVTDHGVFASRSRLKEERPELLKAAAGGGNGGQDTGIVGRILSGFGFKK
jgi:hypothetical protein